MVPPRGPLLYLRGDVGSRIILNSNSIWCFVKVKLIRSTGHGKFCGENQVNIAVLHDDCEVGVIGAGPYGLAVAAHLKAAKVATRVFGASRAWCKGVAGADGCSGLAAGFESTVPGLHFAGSSSVKSFGPLLRFIAGAGYAARSVTHAALAYARLKRVSLGQMDRDFLTASADDVSRHSYSKRRELP
jgi:hypothetical protein